ncbi:MAG TPA: hypothetical protein DCS93_10665 [Microscillaceae bacterium]|nr:hypothetical protein [Microscillaceae bacterium]
MKKSIATKGLLVLLCVCISTFLLAQTNQLLLEKTVQVKQKQGTLLDFVKYLNQSQGIPLFYDESMIPDKIVKLGQKNWELKALLNKLFQNTSIEYRYISGQIILRKKKKTKVNFSGTIKVDGEQLAGATVYVPELGIGSTTDANGYYSLILPPGKYTSVFSFIGHERENRTLQLKDDTSMDINLSPSIDKLGEVVVSAPQKKQADLLEATQTGAHQVDLQQVKRMPILGGDTDVLKSIQTLPGIQNATPGVVNFSVRGGTYDQNLVLLDGIPVYNTSHSLGFFSSINPDAVDKVTIYKGDIPAKYGRRLSSITTMQTSNDLVKKFNLSGDISLLSSRLSVNTPLGKKVALRIAGRISTSAIANLFYTPTQDFTQPSRNQIHNAEMAYTDLIASVLVKPSDKDQVKFTTMLSQDQFEGFNVVANRTFNWKSTGMAINWRRKFKPGLVGNFNLHYSNFQKGYLTENALSYKTNGVFVRRVYGITYNWQAAMEQIGAQMDFTYQLSPKSSLNFGAMATKHRFHPGKTFGSQGINDITLLDRHSVETALYLMHQLQLSPKLEINYGTRISGFYNIGGIRYIYNDTQRLSQHYKPGELMDSFFGLEPRFNLRYKLNPNTSLKISYNRNYQYLHQLNNSSVQLPTNIWLPVSNNVKPRFVDQFSLGYFIKLGKQGKWDFSVEAYARFMHQVIDYRDNANLFLNDNLANEVRTGTGQAFGMELMLRKKGKRLNGVLSYTLSRVIFNIPGINQGEPYAPRYDRPHNVSLNLSYELGRRWRIASTFTYMSGAYTTLPRGWFTVNNRLYNYFTERNSFRLPYFMQWDIGITLKSKQKRRWQGEWTFGVTNVLNRSNALAIFRDQRSYHPSSNNLTNMYLAGWLPYITYTFKF